MDHSFFHNNTYFLTSTEPPNSVTNSTNLDLDLPAKYTTISPTSRNVIVVYCFIFLVGASGNLSVFLSVYRRALGSKLKWRITILIIHLSLADLIVICVVIPSEVVWRSTIQWHGGDVLCKLCQFGRAFGLYLSSMVIICISVDRFYAIVWPLKMVSGGARVKMMLAASWAISVLFAAPQMFVFSVQRHPKYKSFQQCVSYAFLTTEQDEIVYNLFSVAAMYFIPLFVIIFSYSMILWKIIQKSKEHHQQASSLRRELMHGPTPSQEAPFETKVMLRRNTTSTSIMDRCNNSLRERRRDRNGRTGNDAAVLMMARAKWKILRLTCIIVLVFLLCWTPYVFMLLWYMFDRPGAQQVNAGLQDGLFMMAVANSCVNPFVYGNYTRGGGGGEQRRAAAASAREMALAHSAYSFGRHRLCCFRFPALSPLALMSGKSSTCGGGKKFSRNNNGPAEGRDQHHYCGDTPIIGTTAGGTSRSGAARFPVTSVI